MYIIHTPIQWNLSIKDPRNKDTSHYDNYPSYMYTESVLNSGHPFYRNTSCGPKGVCNYSMYREIPQHVQANSAFNSFFNILDRLMVSVNGAG